MLTVHLSIVAIGLFTLLLAMHSSASLEAIKTKQAMLESMNKQFAELASEALLQQILSTQGGCSEKKRVAAEKLKQLAELLAEKGIKLQVGFYKNGECQLCHEVGELVQINEELIYAGELVLACTETGLQIASSNSLGIPAIIFKHAFVDGWFNVVKTS